MILPGFPSIFAGRAAVTSDNVNTMSSTSDATTITFSSKNLGSAQTNRRLVAVMQWEPTANTVSTVTALSIDGTAGVKLVEAAGQYDAEARSSIWVVDGDQTATSGDVIVTVSTQAWKRMAISLYQVYGNDFPQVYGTASNFQSVSGTQLSATIPLTTSGPCIAGVSCGTSSSSVSLNSYTRDSLQTLESGNSTFATFSLQLAANESLNTLNANGQKSMTAVSFF